MEPTARLFLCIRCHAQVVLCSWCDHGQIYCGKVCAFFARQKSIRLARSRYQKTFNGRRNHAACQARYRAKLKKKVTDHTSPPVSQNAPMEMLVNEPKKTETGQSKQELTCCFCRKSVSSWIRNDFLRRRGHKKTMRTQAHAQAP
jgi:hypothetical protein